MATMTTRRTIGVIGGMGPAATVHFMARVLALTPAVVDQDHVRLIVDNNGGVLDRNAALREEGPSPAPALAAMARGLERAGAEALVMPCNTAHAFADAVRAATPLPLIDLIEVVCDEAMAGSPRRVGVLAADGCRRAGLYQAAFARRGVEAVMCDDARHAAFMALLYRIKAGDLGSEVRIGMAALAHEHHAPAVAAHVLRYAMQAVAAGPVAGVDADRDGPPTVGKAAHAGQHACPKLELQ